MQVFVDLDLCQSNGLCTAVAPDLFELRDDGYLEIRLDHPDEARRPAVLEAARRCPTQAITVVG